MYLNTYGQTKFHQDKQLQVQDLIKSYNCDIVHLQETEINENSFQNCNFFKNNFTIISNNSETKYGTCSAVKSSFNVEDVEFDIEGRVISFNIGPVTFCNVYLPAGTDSESRASRESYCSL